MYIFTTLGNAHKNVWESSSSCAFFGTKFLNGDLLKKLYNEIAVGPCFAVGCYAPYYGRNISQQGEKPQYDHASLLRLKNFEYQSAVKYDLKITFKWLMHMLPAYRKLLDILKPAPVPLIAYVDDARFFNTLNLDPDFLTSH